MQNYSDIITFLKFAASRSTIVKSSHFGNYTDVLSENFKDNAGVKQYPLLLLTPSDGNAEGIQNAKKVSQSQDIFMITKYKFLPDGTTDNRHKTELYFSEMEKALFDILRYCQKYTSPFLGVGNFGFTRSVEGENIIIKCTVTVFYSPDCIISTVENHTTYSGLVLPTVNPDNLLSIYQ